MAPMIDIPKVQATLNTMLLQFRSVILSTLEKENRPLASYAPFISIGNDFIILISKTAPHFQNLVERKYASIMLLNEEKDTPNIFFRPRLTFSVEAQLMPKTDNLVELFKARHGEFVSTLVEMDFSFIKLVPYSGLIVLGPGQAFMVNANQQVIGQQGLGTGHRGK